MSAWFRSAEMTFVSLIINEDAAHFTIKSLGELGVVQFTDVSAAFFRAFHRQRLTCARVVSQLNSEQTAFQRRYISYVKRCDELERKLRFFTSELAPHAITAEVLEMFCVFFHAFDSVSHWACNRNGTQILCRPWIRRMASKFWRPWRCVCSSQLC